MSEIGSGQPARSTRPSRSTARASTRICGGMNRRGRRPGAHVGARVTRLELGAAGRRTASRCGTPAGDASRDRRAGSSTRAGRSRARGAGEGPARAKEPSHRIGSVWGRFEGVADVDDLGPESFRARVRHTSRGGSRRCTSATRATGSGSSRSGTASRASASSASPPRDDPGIRSEAGFRAFLDEPRRRARSARGRAKRSTPAATRSSPTGPRSFFSADRWALTGESAAFADPLYSPGADFIALENDFVTDLGRVAISGARRAPALAERTALYDRFMQFRYEAAHAALPRPVRAPRQLRS